MRNYSDEGDKPCGIHGGPSQPQDTSGVEFYVVDSIEGDNGGNHRYRVVSGPHDSTDIMCACGPIRISGQDDEGVRGPASIDRVRSLIDRGETVVFGDDVDADEIVRETDADDGGDDTAVGRSFEFVDRTERERKIIREVAIRQHGLDDDTDTSVEALAGTLDWTERFVDEILVRLARQGAVEQDGDQWRCVR